MKNDFRSRTGPRPKRSNGEEAGRRHTLPTSSRSSIVITSEDRTSSKDRAKRSLSCSRDKQSPRLPKAVCRPKGETMAEEISTPLLSCKSEVKIIHSPLQETLPVKEIDLAAVEVLEPMGKKVTLPKLRLREKNLHKDLDTGTNIFKHRMVKRTTITSIKRTTILNSKVVRRKSIQKDSD